MTERALLGILSNQLRALRLPDEDAVIVSVAAERNPDCEPDSDSAIRATVFKHGFTGTASALHLQDALSLARGDAERQREAAAKKKAEAA